MASSDGEPGGGGRVLVHSVGMPFYADPRVRVEQRHWQQPHRPLRRHRAVKQELDLRFQAAGTGDRSR